jgi:hypothetical protein
MKERPHSVRRHGAGVSFGDIMKSICENGPSKSGIPALCASRTKWAARAVGPTGIVHGSEIGSTKGERSCAASQAWPISAFSEEEAENPIGTR